MRAAVQKHPRSVGGSYDCGDERHISKLSLMKWKSNGPLYFLDIIKALKAAEAVGLNDTDADPLLPLLSSSQTHTDVNRQNPEKCACEVRERKSHIIGICKNYQNVLICGIFHKINSRNKPNNTICYPDPEHWDWLLQIHNYFSHYRDIFFLDRYWKAQIIYFHQSTRYILHRPSKVSYLQVQSREIFFWLSKRPCRKILLAPDEKIEIE